MPAPSRSPANGHDAVTGTLLRLVRSEPTATRASLIERSGMGRTIVTQRVNELVDVGLLAEAGMDKSTGGRAPRTVRFRREAACVVGIELGVSSLEVALTDLAGRALGFHEEAWDVTRGPDATLDRIDSIIETLLATHRPPGTPMVGIGMGLPGPVEYLSGTPVAPPVMPGWAGYPVKERLTSRHEVGAWVDNDVNVMAMGELQAGNAAGVRDFLYVKVGTGVGAGLVSRGRLHRGAGGAAGDIGHIAVADAAPLPCRCGKRGCLETLAGGAALAAAASAKAQDGDSPFLAARREERADLTARDVADGARSGDLTCINLLKAAGEQIGRALAAMINFFNPSLVVIGGGVALSGDLLLAAIRHRVYDLSLPLATRSLRVEMSALSNQAGMIGAAFTAIEELLSPQQLTTWTHHLTDTSPPQQTATA
ncbi:ROK family protein [Streptomyces mayonensis]|uniref:ROK family protein n=1 Tax=Streptomyces mayonensis TaxID=2750816 RepID=UPI001C1DF162|nr:ROK family protein [Streptomyces sp. A108]MBU6529607.1 ROK family protein [Streptomyces sp. A108]